MLATQHQRELTANIDALLESNQWLCRRLMDLEAAFDVQTTESARQTIASNRYSLPLATRPQRAGFDAPKPQYQDFNQAETSADVDVSQLSLSPETASMSSSQFETDLESSWVYRRAKRKSMDFSMRSSIVRSNAWSMFSGLSLSDVSIIAVLALPVYSDDLANPQHYDFGSRQQATPKPPEEPNLDKSIYHNCLEVKALLMQLPEFPDIFADASVFDVDTCNPMKEIWRIFRRGFPLLILLKELELSYDENLATVSSGPEAFVYKFIEVCIDSLKINPAHLFTMSDLMGDSNLEFLRVST